MMVRTRTRTKLGIIFLAAVLLLVVVAAALRFFSSVSIYSSPSAVPIAEREHNERYAQAIEESTRIVRETIFGANIPGLSVAVGINGELAWASGFGWSDLETRAAVTPDTRFRLGTASTTLTSAAVGVLLESGALRLDDEIQTYVPEFPRKQWPVTLRQLMAHTAGLGTDNGREGPLFAERCERPLDALRRFADDNLLFEPGTRYQFSTYGWIPVSAAIESVAKQPFMRVMRDRVFEPLGMSGTNAESSTEENPERIGEPEEDPPFAVFIRDSVIRPMGLGRAKPASEFSEYYEPRFGAATRYGSRISRLHNLSCYAGAMSFFSSPSDMVRFGLARNGSKLLKAGTLEQLQTAERAPSPEEIGHGLGWNTRSITVAGQQAPAIVSDGDLFGGRVASILILPSRGIVVAAMSNLTGSETSSLAERVADVFVQKPPR